MLTTTGARPNATERTMLGAELTFYFDNGATPADLFKITKKVQRHINTSYYPSVAAFFANKNEIRAIITYEGRPSKFDSIDNIIDSVKPSLQRIIDSHDEAASYRWSL